MYIYTSVHKASESDAKAKEGDLFRILNDGLLATVFLFNATASPTTINAGMSNVLDVIIICYLGKWPSMWNHKCGMHMSRERGPNKRELLLY